MKQKVKNSLKVVCLAATLFFGLSAHAQQNDWWTTDGVYQAKFIDPENNKGGFDTPTHLEWNGQFELITVNDTAIVAPIQSVYRFEAFHVRVILSSQEFSGGSWYLNDTIVFPSLRFAGDTVDALLPAQSASGLLEYRSRGKTLAILQIKVFKPITEHLIIVGLGENPETFKFQRELKKVFSQAGIDVVISNKTAYQDSSFKRHTVFENPNLDHSIYTRDMRRLRDNFFDHFPTTDKESYYLFLIDRFRDSTLQAYAANNKAIAFATRDAFYENPTVICRELARAIGMLNNSWENGGPKEGSTENLMDSGSGQDLHYYQWLELRHSARSFAYYDAEEDVRTNNGLVAYYFWEEDENGFIKLENGEFLKALVRPFKKNYFSYHLNVSERLYATVFEISKIPVVWWHLILWTALTTLFIVTRIKWLGKWKRKQKPLLRKSANLIFFSILTAFYYLIFFFVNAELRSFEVDAGELADFKGMSLSNVKNEILYNMKLKQESQDSLRSEILVSHNGNWTVQRSKPVLYFSADISNENVINNLRFITSSDTLKINGRDDLKVQTHYFVIEFKNEAGESTQRIFNHAGFEVGTVLDKEDPAKRILLFVNGYRPTSTGHSFEDNFHDVTERGLEYDETSNMIYNFDRYDYWQPWQAMDDKFKARINPQAVYYADGHHSVSTSNYRSLFYFTSVSSSYPERCKNPNKHTCNELKINTQSLFGKEKSHTTTLLPIKENYGGFKKREENGRIAGLNLLSLLNDTPGNARNDTVYIVAHSMGYAYALGMIEELRGELNFGGFIILAPENASSGRVNKSEWQYVWQYGSKLSDKLPACIQDGVAPQTRAAGLSEKERCYFPQGEWYTKQGFFSSHFIGYYTWVFDIEEGKKGFIPQR